jgi:transposase-like protein
MNSKITELIDLVQKLPEDCLDEAIESITKIIAEKASVKPIPPCPHCKSTLVTRFGRKNGKQRYRCNSCRMTFLETTKTALSQSHYGESVWKQAIRDTLSGESMDNTAVALGMTHQTAFHMRHKILRALECVETQVPTVLDGVCELDDTYVLESMKGTKVQDDYWRPARLHGAKAQKRGISNEYVSICTGVERDGKVIAKTVNRATPSKEDISDVFGERIQKTALVLCDGAKGYGVLTHACECEVSNVKKPGDGQEVNSFYNINTANGLHSFIKNRYTDYRGVATKYLNRYNTLFSKAFRSRGDVVDEIYNMLISTDMNLYNSIKSVKTANLLDI